ncbi:phenoloxidase-activating factor 3-like [Diorhabda carinulata]|uniref:phenoloxidase-activating factor 3-like n=1 Tax=Diorhabda carinulata TaxID=1163345 RepID=UPI0025A2E864|nr:phenoloxidase-activating factor 3-like [Diorhabda carinulata]
MKVNMVLRCSLPPLFILIVTVTSSNGQQWRQDDEGCIATNGQTGTCIPVRMCPTMVKALLTVKRPLSKEAREQLESYLCSIANDYKVCCPSSPINIKEDTIDTSEVSESADIIQHPNYHLLPSNCGYIDLGSVRVLHGDKAGLTEFPWMALLSYREADNKAHFKCAGTIINSRYILTAAHCLEERSRLLGARVGEYDIYNKSDCFAGVCNDPVQDLIVEEVIVHSKYQIIDNSNDIAILRVTPIRFNEKNIKPICLPRAKNLEPKDDYVEVTGWGVTKQFTSKRSDILQKAFLPVVNKTACQEIYANNTEITIDDTKICAGGGVKKTNACNGDSGGPIQQRRQFNDGMRYIQLGIVSIGIEGCDIPEIFTKVAHYMDWILDNMKP